LRSSSRIFPLHCKVLQSVVLFDPLCLEMSYCSPPFFLFARPVVSCVDSCETPRKIDVLYSRSGHATICHGTKIYFAISPSEFRSFPIGVPCPPLPPFARSHVDSISVDALDFSRDFHSDSFTLFFFDKFAHDHTVPLLFIVNVVLFGDRAFGGYVSSSRS